MDYLYLCLISPTVSSRIGIERIANGREGVGGGKRQIVRVCVLKSCRCDTSVLRCNAVQFPGAPASQGERDQEKNGKRSDVVRCEVNFVIICYILHLVKYSG